MGVIIAQVDSFTNEPFSGNPAAVCLLKEPRNDRWMQNVAFEMGLSETAFLRQLSSDAFDLRWFTPTTEVDLCGHATLASAHVLWEQQYLPRSTVARFKTRSGWLTARSCGDWIEMDFPAEVDQPVQVPAGLGDALGAEPRYLGQNRLYYLAELDSETTIRSLRPDFRRLVELPVMGLIVTAPASTEGFDFVSRFFAPAAGIDEDPVTGSAHCCLGPFWQRRMQKDTFTAYQASARGGIVRLRVDGSRVCLSGQAITVLRAELVF